MSKKKMAHPLSEGELDHLAGRFRMLGEPMRLKILQSVCRAPRTVSDIVAATGSTQANVSKHLALLAASGILRREKEGQCVYYGIKDQLAIKMCELVRTQLNLKP
jgi:DNA-binding transcriptional ArsR family regulator